MANNKMIPHSNHDEVFPDVYDNPEEISRVRKVVYSGSSVGSTSRLSSAPPLFVAVAASPSATLPSVPPSSPTLSTRRGTQGARGGGDKGEMMKGCATMELSQQLSASTDSTAPSHLYRPRPVLPRVAVVTLT